MVTSDVTNGGKRSKDPLPLFIDDGNPLLIPLCIDGSNVVDVCSTECSLLSKDRGREDSAKADKAVP